MAWAYSTGDNNTTIASKHSGPSGNYGWLLTRAAATDDTEWRVSENGTAWNGGGGVNDSWEINTWTHVAGVYDSANLRLYLDNVADAGVFPVSVTGNINDSGLDLRVGYRAPNEEPMIGTLNEVQIHTAGRSADWIASEYAQTNNNATF